MQNAHNKKIEKEFLLKFWESKSLFKFKKSFLVLFKNKLLEKKLDLGEVEIMN